MLVQFDEPQRSADGRTFVAQVHGRRTSDGIWEAWLAFQPEDGSEPVATGRETEQLTRGDLRFWAAGISRDYLAGALIRALTPRPALLPPSLHVPAIPGPTASDVATALPSDAPPLDPYVVHASVGEYALRQALRALDATQLRAIISAYRIPELDVVDLARTFEDALAERIVAGVQQRVGNVPLRVTRELRGATK